MAVAEKAPPKGKAKPKGKAGFITQKIGPLPVWAWGGIAVAVFAVVYFISRRTSTATSLAQPSNTLNPDQTAGMTPSTGGSIGGNPTPLDTLPSDLQAMFGAQSDALASFADQVQAELDALAGSMGVTGSWNPFDYGTYVGDPSGQPTDVTNPSSSAQVKLKLPKGVAPKSTTLAGGVKRTVYAGGRVVLQAPGKKAYVAQKGSGAPAKAASGSGTTTTLANGTRRTVYPNGRVVLQAPGKKAYVAKKGG